MMDPSALGRYMKQKGIKPPGSPPGMPGGGGGMQPPGMPEAPGMNDPFGGGDFAPPLTNPEDAQNEFDPRRRSRPYMPNLPGMDGGGGLPGLGGGGLF